MKLLEEYSTTIGLLALTFVLVILFSTPSMLFAETITVVDTELAHASGNEIPIRTKLDFGSDEHVNRLPTEIGDWNGFDYNSADIASMLGADVMLMRAYSSPDSNHTIFLLIVQSTNRSSFHPPIVCYPSLGYTIEEEDGETVHIQSMSWAETPLFEENEDDTHFNGTISTKKIVVAKKSGGKITERRVVLYFYIRREFTSNTVTMIRISALAPIDGSYDDVLRDEKSFLVDLFPHLFEITETEKLVVQRLMDSGVPGWIVIVVLFAIPILIICYPRFRRE